MNESYSAPSISRGTSSAASRYDDQWIAGLENPNHLGEPRDRVVEMLQYVGTDYRVESVLLEGQVLRVAQVQPGLDARTV